MISKVMIAVAGVLAVASTVDASAADAASSASAKCAAASARLRLPQTEIRSATWIAAGAANAEKVAGLPGYCEIQGVIRRTQGSEIGVTYRLPEPWNGKVLALGGGGWLGNVRLAPDGAAVGLLKGYATLQTDGGHPVTAPVFDASSWALRPDGSLNTVKVEDFSEVAIHLMTERGKQLAKDYYGSAPKRAYYQGCSTGGRMGLMEVQRHPDDFDGVIAGAPVYTLQTQTTQTLRSVAFNQPGGRLLPEHPKLINDAVLARCDAADGAKDGVLRDPRQCDFDPASLRCATGQPAAACLNDAQITAVRRVYEGERATGGMVASYPLEKGGEPGWRAFIPVASASDWGPHSGGLQAFRGPVLGNKDFDLSKFTANDVLVVRKSPMARIYEAADPRIDRFVKKGGKLILYHGMNDPGPSMRGTLEYFDAIRAANAEAKASSRLFLAPGVAHCRGGAGPSDVDWLAALDTWVEQGRAPEEVKATKPDASLTWNLCAYPKLPTGQADGTYQCR